MSIVSNKLQLPKYHKYQPFMCIVSSQFFFFDIVHTQFTSLRVSVCLLEREKKKRRKKEEGKFITRKAIHKQTKWLFSFVKHLMHFASANRNEYRQHKFVLFILDAIQLRLCDNWSQLIAIATNKRGRQADRRVRIEAGNGNWNRKIARCIKWVKRQFNRS